jgi:hypothetical protein
MTKALNIILVSLVIVTVFYVINSFLKRKCSNEKFSIDTIDTGIERVLWGPLYTVPGKDITDEQRPTIHSEPWCSSLLSQYVEGGCVVKASTPYEKDKI